EDGSRAAGGAHRRNGAGHAGAGALLLHLDGAGAAAAAADHVDAAHQRGAVESDLEGRVARHPGGPVGGRAGGDHQRRLGGEAGGEVHSSQVEHAGGDAHLVGGGGRKEDGGREGEIVAALHGAAGHPHAGAEAVAGELHRSTTTIVGGVGADRAGGDGSVEGH